jgi:hypothetical protein
VARESGVGGELPDEAALVEAQSSEDEAEEEASLDSSDNEAGAGAAVEAPSASPWSSPEAPSTEAPSRAAKGRPSHLRYNPPHPLLPPQSEDTIVRRFFL